MAVFTSRRTPCASLSDSPSCCPPLRCGSVVAPPIRRIRRPRQRRKPAGSSLAAIPSATATTTTPTCHRALPSRQFGGCPISSRRFNKDVQYLTTADAKLLAEQLQHIRLARYTYKGQTEPRLGFIIEDDP